MQDLRDRQRRSALREIHEALSVSTTDAPEPIEAANDTAFAIDLLGDVERRSDSEPIIVPTDETD